jgi:hypothetical protein
MKKRLLIVALVVLASLLAFVAAGPDIRSWENAEFIVKIVGIEGTEFDGFCTHEVKYVIGSRTEETDIQGAMTADENTFGFVIPGTEISCRINNKTPGKLITVILLKDGIEVNRAEGVGYDFYLDYYPAVT